MGWNIKMTQMLKKSASKRTSFVRVVVSCLLSELSVKLFDRSNIWTVGTKEGRKDIAAILVDFLKFHETSRVLLTHVYD